MVAKHGAHEKSDGEQRCRLVLASVSRAVLMLKLERVKFHFLTSHGDYLSLDYSHWYSWIFEITQGQKMRKCLNWMIPVGMHCTPIACFQGRMLSKTEFIRCDYRIELN